MVASLKTAREAHCLGRLQAEHHPTETLKNQSHWRKTISN